MPPAVSRASGEFLLGRARAGVSPENRCLFFDERPRVEALW
jgi:hypothetical protein